jgi:phosphoglycolate phosphatase
MTLFFDLDGPLLDVSPRYVALHQTLLEAAGVEPMPAERYWQCKQAALAEEDILRELGVLERVPHYLKRRVELIETAEWLVHDRPWPWTRPTLARLAKQHTLVLVTARANRPLLDEQLARLELAGFFDEVLSEPGGQRVDEQKAALIRGYLTRHGQALAGHWMIGDTEADVGAGKLLGLRTVAVLSGIRSAEILARSQPDHLLPDIRKLPLL